MLTPDDIAIIVCTRNRPEMLREALASITTHTAVGAEVLVIDSASSNSETKDVASTAGVGYVRTDIKGLSIARNVGLRSTDRDIVLFTDDDCLATPGWIAPILSAFADSSVGAVTGYMADSGVEKPDVSVRLTEPLDGIDAGHGAIMAFRRELTLGLGGFDEVLGAGRPLAGAEDLDMFVRVLDAGSAMVLDPSSRIDHVNVREGIAYTDLLRGYGLGLGALAAKWVRIKPRLGIPMTAVFVRRNVARIVRYRRDIRRGPAERAMLGGIFRGFIAGLRMRLNESTFIDPHPPRPTPLSDTPVPTIPGGADVS